MKYHIKVIYLRDPKEEWLKHYGSATVGERGQIVLPAAARKRFNINPGERLLVLGSSAGGFERLVLMKSEAVTGLLKHLFNIERSLSGGGAAGGEKMLKKGINRTKRVEKEIKKVSRK